jgi:hypothetical protein
MMDINVFQQLAPSSVSGSGLTVTPTGSTVAALTVVGPVGHSANVGHVQLVWGPSARVTSGNYTTLNGSYTVTIGGQNGATYNNVTFTAHDQIGSQLAPGIVLQFRRGVGELDELTNLAGELITLSSDEELDHFFGDFVKKAIGGIKSFTSSPLGQTLVGGLKNVAKAALPMAATALGNAIVPGMGGTIGGKLGSFAASKLEAEDRFLADLLGETSSGEDQFLGDILGGLLGSEREDQFLGSLVGGLLGGEGEMMEKAKDVVKVAAAATKKAKAAPPGANINHVVRTAIMDAIKEFAPTLLHGRAQHMAHPHAMHPAHAAQAMHAMQATHAHHGGGAGGDGRWYRRGNKIILVGA